MNAVLNWFTDWWKGAEIFFTSLLYSLGDMLKDLFFWLIETVGTFGKTFIAGFGGMPEYSIAQHFTSLPSDVRQVIALTGLAECVVLIVAAITIRLTLQLIPFTRLGS